jgi:putative nucleotidyltransferase with HDIG domain
MTTTSREENMSSPDSPVNLKQAICNIETLPAMPIIAQKILTLNLDSDEGERTMLRLIEQDPLISAKIIGLANTPLFGTSKRVSSIFDAAMLLGITRVKSVTIGIAVMSSLAKITAGKLDIQGLWLHSLAVAIALRILSRAMPANTRPLDDEIFLAGLLHDIGYLVLNQLDQKRSDELHTRFASDNEHSAGEIEAELLELNHGELGAELARYWALPESVVAILRYHHDPKNADAAAGQPLVGMLNLVEKILPTFGIIERTTCVTTPGEWEYIGIDPTKADELIAQILEQAEAAKQTSGNFP